MDLYVYVGLTVLAIINVSTTFYLATRDYLEPIQKVSQIFLVWLIPGIMAFVVFVISRHQDVPVKLSRRDDNVGTCYGEGMSSD